MKHRHIETDCWTVAAVDSALARGTLVDWRELFQAVKANSEIGDLVKQVARERDLGGASILAEALVDRIRAKA